jgi:ribosome-associated protein
MRSAAADVADLGKKTGHTAVRQNVDERTTWHVVDFVDVVVHVFEPNTRAYYDIEMLWGDAPRLEWKRSEADAQVLKAKTRSRSTAKAARHEASDADED